MLGRKAARRYCALDLSGQRRASRLLRTIYCNPACWMHGTAWRAHERRATPRGSDDTGSRGALDAANALTWTWFLLAQKIPTWNRHWRRNWIRAGRRAPTIGGSAATSLHRNVIKNRCAVSAGVGSWATRRCSFEVGGYRIRRHKCFHDAMLTHRDCAVFSEPERF